MNKEIFELAYRRAMESGGHSYDPWDIACAWKEYQQDPTKYDWLFPAKINVASGEDVLC
jgi:hypothetical protein